LACASAVWRRSTERAGASARCASEESMAGSTGVGVVSAMAASCRDYLWQTGLEDLRAVATTR
jgi:hypothetical protein